MQKWLLIIVMLVRTFALKAEVVESFHFNKGNISLEIPNNWQVTKDLFGIPLTLLGPVTEGARPVINFTPTGIEQLKFDQASLEKNQSEYKEGRLKWLHSKEGALIEFYPYQFSSNKKGVEFHRIGYAFTLNEIQFKEYSYFILCNNKLYHAKVLLRKNHEKMYEERVNRLMESFDCK